MPTTLARVIVDALVRADVPRVFAVESDHASSLIDVARTAGLDVVIAHTAASACVMAAATGELGDVPGVAVVDVDQDGVVAALAQAARDRSPMVVLSTASPSSVSDPGTCTSRIDVTPDSAGHGIAHGIQLALHHPRGPVVLALPPGAAAAASVPVATSVARPVPDPPSSAILDRAARALRDAARALVVVGLEARSPADASWLRAFAEARPAPVLATPKARGAMPDPHPLALGTLGAPVAAEVIAQADLVVAVGVDAVELRGRDAWAAPALWLGRSSAERRVGDIEIVGDIALILEELAPRTRDCPRADWDVAALDRLKRRVDARPTRGPDGVVHAIRQAMPAGTVAVFDATLGSCAAAWACVAPREIIVPNGERDGAAVPAGVAVALARRGSPVVVFTDARGLAHGMAELDRPLVLDTPLMIVVLGDMPAALMARARDMDVRLAGAANESALLVAVDRALGGGRPMVAHVSLAAAPGEGWTRPV